MTRITISMPEQMNAYIEAQVSGGRYGNVSEYVRDLVRRDQDSKQKAIAELRGLLERAEASGIGDRTMSELRETAFQEARQKGLLNE